MVKTAEGLEGRVPLLENKGKVVASAPAATLLLNAATQKMLTAQYWRPGKVILSPRRWWWERWLKPARFLSAVLPALC